jgi:hypothetical protein
MKLAEADMARMLIGQAGGEKGSRKIPKYWQ